MSHSLNERIMTLVDHLFVPHGVPREYPSPDELAERLRLNEAHLRLLEARVAEIERREGRPR
jgi:hypothetical protein